MTRSGRNGQTIFFVEIKDKLHSLQGRREEKCILSFIEAGNTLNLMSCTEKCSWVEDNGRV